MQEERELEYATYYSLCKEGNCLNNGPDLRKEKENNIPHTDSRES